MNHLADAELQAWIDGELASDDRIRVADHLASCGDCRDALSELQSATDLFRDALVLHDESMRGPRGGQPGAPGRRGVRKLPRWAGRAAAVTLLLGGAAAAAVVPGSPLRDFILGNGAEPVTGQPTEIVSTTPLAIPGASISVRPLAGDLRVRVRDFPAGTRIRIMLSEGPVAVASLPDSEANARFVVAAGLLEVVGPGNDGAVSSDDDVILRLPRRLRSGVVEVDGDIAVRVSGGRMVGQRQISPAGDGGVVIVVGG